MRRDRTRNAKTQTVVLQMVTPIGENLRGNRLGAALCNAVAIVAVAVDFWLSAELYSMTTRMIVAAAVGIVCVSQRPFSGSALGFRVKLLQPMRYWMKALAIAGAMLMVPIAVFSVMAWQRGWEFPRTSPEYLGANFVHMCVMAPVLEELIYRLGICYPAAAVIGPKGAILLSGAVFAALHFVSGNPAPDNFFGGFVLAWVYLKSGSLAMPIAIHSLGNAIALGSHIVNWFLFGLV